MNDSTNPRALTHAGKHTTIRTELLTLIPAAAYHVRAELAGNAAIGTLLDAEIPVSWPPGQYDRDAQEFFLQALEAGGDDAIGWFGWYAIKRASDSERAVLVGCGGYFGPPSENGTVEIGYSVCPEWCGRGYATDLARALVDHALQLSEVVRVIAHTNDDNPASIAVLRRSGFQQAAISDQPGALLFEWANSDR
ncbi:MAG: GNAT family N-acetyltransferase [Gemmatimonadaceae bacterium]